MPNRRGGESDELIDLLALAYNELKLNCASHTLSSEVCLVNTVIAIENVVVERYEASGDQE